MPEKLSEGERHHATVCGQNCFSPPRDDGPAYLTISGRGHLMAPGLHIAFVAGDLYSWTLFTIFFGWRVGCPLPSA